MPPTSGRCSKLEYIVSGLNMMDVIRFPDGTTSTPQMGGIPLYGYCGMRPYTRSICYLARVGKDFFDTYGQWFEKNKVDRSGLLFVSEQTPYNIITYRPDESVAAWDFFTGDWADSGFWRPHPEDLDAVIGPDTKGFYICGAPLPDPVWARLLALREQYHFKIMWEPNGIHTHSTDRENILELLPQLDMASFNLTESKEIFGLDSEQEVLDFLRRQPCPLILLRIGARGMYTIGGGCICLVPSAPLPEGQQVVDVTGCGNSSTAAACVAWCQQNDLAMTGIMANIASNYNLRQKGPYPLFDSQLEEQCRIWARQLYQKGAYQYL